MFEYATSTLHTCRVEGGSERGKRRQLRSRGEDDKGSGVRKGRGITERYSSQFFDRAKPWEFCPRYHCGHCRTIFVWFVCLEPALAKCVSVRVRDCVRDIIAAIVGLCLHPFLVVADCLGCCLRHVWCVCTLRYRNNKVNSEIDTTHTAHGLRGFWGGDFEGHDLNLGRLPITITFVASPYNSSYSTPTNQMTGLPSPCCVPPRPNAFQSTLAKVVTTA